MTYKTGGNTKYVCVIVLAGQLSKLFIPANSRTNAGMFVGCNGDSISASTDQYAKSSNARLYLYSHRMSKIRIINGILTMRTLIMHRKTLPTQPIN